MCMPIYPRALRESRARLRLMNYLTRKETQLALAKHTGLTPNIEELDIDNDTLVVIPNRVIEQGQFKLTTPNNRFSYESSFRLVKNQLRLQAE